MNTIDRTNFIYELTAKIDEYVEEDDLFAGGCCYAAYLLAKALKTAGIKYTTTVFQYHDILNVKNFNDAIVGQGVSHVAIEVKMGMKTHTIGDCEGIYEYFSSTGYEYNIFRYKDVSPLEILMGYVNKKSWNTCYDTRMNKHLAREIMEITKKFTGKEVRMTVPRIF